MSRQNTLTYHNIALTKASKGELSLALSEGRGSKLNVFGSDKHTAYYTRILVKALIYYLDQYDEKHDSLVT